MSRRSFGLEDEPVEDIPRRVECVTDKGTRLEMEFGEIGNFLLMRDDRVALEDLMGTFGEILEGAVSNRETLYRQSDEPPEAFSYIKSSLNKAKKDLTIFLDADIKALPNKRERWTIGVNGDNMVAYKNGEVEFRVTFQGDIIDSRVGDTEWRVMVVLVGSFACLVARVMRETDDPADAFHCFQSELEELRDWLEMAYELGRLRLN